MNKNNIMRQLKIEKVTLNIGAGTVADKLDKAFKLLGAVTGRKPVKTKTKKRIPGWGLRPGLPIGCKVTLRGKKAEELLKRLLMAKENQATTTQFDDNGNFSFGISEYINIPGVQYDPEIGIIGLEATVTLERPGFRIGKRKIKPKIIPKKQRITQEEAIGFMKQKFDLKIEGGE